MAPPPAKPAAEMKTSVLGITLPIIFAIAFFAVVIFGFSQPFDPTYINIDYVFGKILVAVQNTVSFFTVHEYGSSIKFFVGLLCAFMIGLDFYLFLRIREYEDHHADHVFELAEDDARPTGIVGHVFNEAKDLAKDTRGIVQNASDIVGNTAERFLEKMYPEDYDLFQPLPASERRDLPKEAGGEPVPQVRDKEGTYKWRMVLKLMKSGNPSDWKLAIIEADTILDILMERTGFPGATLGERLRSADSGVFRTLSFAKQAHGVRNKIAHDGLEFKITEREAQQVIRQYEEVFQEFGYI